MGVKLTKNSSGDAWESMAVLMPAPAALTATALEQEKLLCALQLMREASKESKHGVS